MSTLAVRLELGCLMVPMWARPAEPTDEQAIRLARRRERRRVEALPDPPPSAWQVQPHRRQAKGTHRGGKPRVTTPAQEAEIMALRDKGMSRAVIVAELGISEKRVRYVIERARGGGDGQAE